MTEDAEDAALVFEFVEHVSLQAHAAVRPDTSCTRFASPSMRIRPRRRSRFVDATDRSTIVAADRDAQPAAAGLADHPRRHAGARPRARSTVGHVVGRHRDDDARRRLAEQRRGVVQAAAPRDRRRRRSTPRRRCRRCRSSTRRASTARPPSEQSCADRTSRSSASVDQQRLQRALGLEIERRRHRRAPDRASTFRYSLPPSSPRPSPSSTIASPAAWKRRLTHAIGVLEQPDDADDRRRIDRACRRSRCRG